MHRSKKVCSFDRLVGDGEHRWRHLNAKCARRLQVKDEIELGRLQHREIGGPMALDDAAEIFKSAMAKQSAAGIDA